MIAMPALDLRRGRCVQLVGGLSRHGEHVVAQLGEEGLDNAPVGAPRDEESFGRAW